MRISIKSSIFAPEMAQTSKRRFEVENIVSYTLTKRIAELEEENQKLKRRVTELTDRLEKYEDPWSEPEESNIKHLID